MQLGARGSTGDVAASGLQGPGGGTMYKLQRARGGLAAARLCLVLQEHREGHRTGKGHSLEEGGAGKGFSFPVGAKKLQEEGEDVDNV